MSWEEVRWSLQLLAEETVGTTLRAQQAHEDRAMQNFRDH